MIIIEIKLVEAVALHLKPPQRPTSAAAPMVSCFSSSLARPTTSAARNVRAALGHFNSTREVVRSLAGVHR